jgi:hypothetical protein
MAEVFGDAGKTLQDAAEWAWENLEEIQKRWGQLRQWIRSKTNRNDAEPERGILILGPGGVGKTTFARLLTEQVHPLADVTVRYEESLDAESYSFTQRASPPLRSSYCPARSIGVPERGPNCSGELQRINSAESFCSQPTDTIRWERSATRATACTVNTGKRKCRS